MLRCLPLAALLATSAAYADEVFIVPTITDVTVFPRGASVSRVVAADLPAGKHIITIPYLKSGVQGAAPRVSVPDGVAVGAMRLLPRHFKDPKDARTPEQVAAADRVDAAHAAWLALEDQVVFGKAEVEAQSAKNAYLRSLTGAALVNADAQTQMAVADMVVAELSKAWSAQYEASVALRATEEARDKALLAKGLAESEFNALNPPLGPLTLLELSVETATGGPFEIEVDSLVPSAGWRAEYTLNLTRGEAASVAMERKVVLSQTTGEAWSGVDLVLSTANPFAQVDPSDPFPSQAILQSKARKSLALTRSAPVVAEADMSVFRGGGEDAPAPAQPVAQAVIKGLSVTYDYPEAVSLGSDSGELILALDDFTFKAREFNRAAPRFDQTAFLMAEFTNETQEPFLPGQVSVSRDGVFVGRSNLPLVPAGGQTDVSFGTLEGLRLDYKRLDNDTGDRGFLTTSSTRVQQMEFSVENLLDKAETVQTIFALPFAEEEDLEVFVGARPNPGETDFKQRRGVSVWNLEVGPGETKTVRINVEMNWPEGQRMIWQP